MWITSDHINSETFFKSISESRIIILRKLFKLVVIKIDMKILSGRFRIFQFEANSQYRADYRLRQICLQTGKAVRNYSKKSSFLNIRHL